MATILSYGQLAYGDTTTRGDSANDMGDNLALVDLGTDFKTFDLQLGIWSSCFLSDRGAIKCFGYNYYGQLGYGDTNNRGDSSNTIGDNLPTIDLGTDFIAIKLEKIPSFHSCALNSNSLWKCWGYDHCP